MSDRQHIRMPRRSAILCAAMLTCALLAPGVSALESDPSPRTSGSAAADDEAGGAPSSRPGATANGSVRSVRTRGAAAPVELRPRPVTTPVPARTATPKPGRGDAPPADGTAKDAGHTRNTKADAPSRVWPLEKGDYTFTQPFGCVPQLGGFYRTNPGCPADSPAVHGGIDLAAPQGTRIYAAASGWVTEAGLDREVGLANTRLIIQHDGKNEGFATEYLHWNTSYVRVGDYVRAGEPIAEVGSVGWSTGPHLHFAVIAFDTGDYEDPVRWLPKATDAGAYRGLEPGRRPLRFEHASANMPEHADPAPPPAPTRERVPESPPDASGSTSRDERGKRQRKAERRDERRAQRADERAGRDAPPESGSPRRNENEPDDNASSEPVDAGDTGASTADDANDAVAVKERKRDRADATERGGKQGKDRSKNRDDAGDRNGGKDKPNRNQDKDSGKGGNGKNDGNGNGGKNDGKGGRKDGKGDGGSGGKQRDKGASEDAESTPPTAPADEPAETVDPSSGAGANDGSAPDDAANGGDAADEVATPPTDDAMGDAPATDPAPKPRKKQRGAEAEAAA